MKFKLDFTPQPDFSLNYRNPMLFVGSCFADNIGAKFRDSLFDCMVNPNGTVFNPISIGQILKRGIDGKPYTEDDLGQHNEKWFSWFHYHGFKQENRRFLLDELNTLNDKVNARLEAQNLTVFISLGTAWVYEFEEVGVVANCHKLPASAFHKRLLSVDEIVNTFDHIVSDMPNARFVFTVSPVRHIRDGLEDNSWSKSVLHMATRQLVGMHNNVSYFPAYEILIDELRDYRFYDRDLVHPNALAIDYLWETISETTFDSETRLMVSEYQKLRKRLDHRFLDPDSKEAFMFMEKTKAQEQKFKQQFFTE